MAPEYKITKFDKTGKQNRKGKSKERSTKEENYKISKRKNVKNWSKRTTETLTKLNTEKEISDKN